MASNVLLLQGPMGPFFKRLALDLEASGQTVFKINLNAGDRLFFNGKNIFDYTAPVDLWPLFLKQCLRELEIDVIYLFGDQRPYHRLAIQVAHVLDIDVFVFEEGYLRPHYITMEKDGVNGHSSIPRTPETYEGIENKSLKQPTPVPYAFLCMAWYATIYFTIGWLGRSNFPHYIHHRLFNPYHEAGIWLRAAFRKYYYRIHERGILKKLTTQHSKKFFLAPLQVYNDAQIKTWSTVPSTAAFIRRVISSFSKNAQEDTLLVIKHHPLDRGYSDYTGIIDKLACKYGCKERVIYIHDLHLPTLLDHTRGTVLLNSTVGLSSLLHGTPVIALGHAVYDMEGLTYQRALETFWNNPGKIDRQFYQRFRNYLIENNQINGNFYRRTPSFKNHTGINYQHPSELTRTHEKTTTKTTTRIEEQLQPESKEMEVADVAYDVIKHTSIA